MEFGILGPLQVLDGHRPVKIPSSGTRATVLAALLVHSNQVVPAQRLIAWMWGDEPPQGATATLYVHISRLRVNLEGRPGEREHMLLTRGAGYELVVGPEALDSHRFEDMVRTAHACLSSDPLAASSTLREALSLWRGRALEGFEERPFARAESVRLEELRLAATEDLMEARLAVGQHEATTAELQSLAAEYPLRERFTAQLMRALYRGARQAEALQAYQRLRVCLADELGIDPSPELRELERAVLRQQVISEPASVPPTASGRPAWALEFKSIPEPASSGARVQVSELGRPMVSLPAELAVEASRPFVSRRGELGLAEGVIADPDRERLAVLWLLGEPGIGKSRLAAEIARRAQSAGGVALFGRCSADILVPYQPFLEALRWYVARVSDPELATRLGEAPGELTRLVPEIGARLPGLAAVPSSSPEIEQHRLFDAVRAWLAAAGAGRPVVVVLDDLQWAARPTLALLGHVARSAEPSRAVLVCTARTTSPDANEALASLAEELDRRGTLALRFELGGFSVGDVGELVETAVGRQLDERLRRVASELHRETAGNPLFVDTLLASLVADPAGLPDQLPHTVTETVQRRVARLPANVAQVLRTASVAGLDFDLRVAGRAAGRDELTALEALEAAGQAGLVEETRPNGYRFRHALVRSALRGELSRSRRVRVHLAVGEALEAVYGDRLDEHAAALAYHFYEAVPAGAAQKAYRYSLLAADRAVRLLHHDEAVDAYGRALELLQMDEKGPLARVDVLLALGAAQRRAGHLEEAQTTLRAAAEESAEQEQHEQLARAAVAFEEATFLLGYRNRGGDALELLRRAAAALPGAESGLRALTLASLSRALDFNGHTADASNRGDEAVAMVQRRGDLAASFAVRLRASRPSVSVAQADVSAARWTELCARAREVGDDDALMLALVNAIWATAMLGDPVAWGEMLADCTQLAAQLRQPRWEPTLSWFRSSRAFLDGDLEAAERFLEAVAHEGLYGVAMFLIRREQGRLAELVPSLRTLVRLNPAAGVWRPGLAALYADLRMLDEARKEFEAFASAGFAGLASHGSRELSLALLAEVCATLEDAHRAPWFVEQLRACEGRLLFFFGSSACLGPADRLLGMLASTAGRPDDAERWHRRGLELARRLNSPLWIAHCLCDYAVHVRPSDSSGSRRMLAEAAGVCDEHGLIALTDRVGHLRAGRLQG